mgnify:FL=1
MRILIVEDEFNLADVIASRLRKEKYTVDVSTDGDDGSYKAMTNIYDLIILDVMLPYKDGFTILKELKENNIKAQVIMLTAMDGIEDKLNGFKGGADDYLTKPFHLEELVARVNIKLKKDINSNNDYLEYGDIRLDLNKKKIVNINNDEEIDVLCKEFLLLECLLRNKDQVVSKEFIYDYVWGMDNESVSNNLEAYVSFIRRKLKAIDSTVNIKALRGLGYKLEANHE